MMLLPPTMFSRTSCLWHLLSSNVILFEVNSSYVVPFTTFTPLPSLTSYIYLHWILQDFKTVWPPTHSLTFFATCRGAFAPKKNIDKYLHTCYWTTEWLCKFDKKSNLRDLLGNHIMYVVHENLKLSCLLQETCNISF